MAISSRNGIRKKSGGGTIRPLPVRKREIYELCMTLTDYLWASDSGLVWATKHERQRYQRHSLDERRN
ncbi:hypothetical protein DF3PB_10040 [uncultured Defluviicoccus sp.]|uniref:Uncharacterized protein n=1 Tax=metagenome TaxID=256318 RepID=A0A380T9G0_9ZZZZ|nr:hypothetical protein DF3PB_10040 [uncultured Defluviicoccus sp.]